MNRKNKFMLFLEGDNDNAGGGSPLDVLDAELPKGEGEPEPQAEPELEPEPEPQPTPPATDPAALAAAFAEGLKQAGFVPPAKQEPEKPLTPEEAKKLLNVMDIDDKFLEEFDNLETRKAKLEAFRDGVIKQADTITQLRLQQFQQQIESRYAPVEQYVTEREALAREERFSKTYPDLAKPELIPLRDTIINGLAAQGVLKGKSEKEAFQLIASSAEAVIKQANPAFKLTAAGSTPTVTTKKTNPNALRPNTSGAGGGTGGKAAADDGAGKAKVLQFL